MKKIALLLAIAVLSALCGFRIYHLNKAALASNTVTVPYQQAGMFQDMKIQILEAKYLTLAEIKDDYPDFFERIKEEDSITDEDVNADKIRYIFLTTHMQNTSSADKKFELYTGHLISLSWGRSDISRYITAHDDEQPKRGSTLFPPSEEKDIIFTFPLREEDFPTPQWDAIEKRSFYLKFMAYPDIIKLNIPSPIELKG